MKQSARSGKRVLLCFHWITKKGVVVLCSFGIGASGDRSKDTTRVFHWGQRRKTLPSQQRICQTFISGGADVWGMRYLKYTLEHAHCTMTCRCLRHASDKEPKNWWQLWAGCEVMDQWCLQTLVFWPSGVMFPVVLRIAQKLVLCHSLSLCIERDVTGLWMGHGSCEFCRSWEKVGHFRVCGTGVAKAWTFSPCPRPP